MRSSRSLWRRLARRRNPLTRSTILDDDNGPIAANASAVTWSAFS